MDVIHQIVEAHLIQLGKRAKPHPLVFYSPGGLLFPRNLLITFLTDCSLAGDNCHL
jgi:hypothetical protein